MSEEMLSSNGSPMFMPVNFIISSYNTCPMISWLAANKPHPSPISILVLFCLRNVNTPKPIKQQNRERTQYTTMQCHQDPLGQFLTSLIRVQTKLCGDQVAGAGDGDGTGDSGCTPANWPLSPSPNSAPTMSTIFQVIAVRSGHHLAPRFGSRVHESVSPVN